MTTETADVPDWARQAGYAIRFEWGPLAASAVTTGVCVVVDVLRFTTAVETAVSRGLLVYPYRWRDRTAATFAGSVGAFLADGRDPAGPSLSPASFRELESGSALVLPSPNGSTCALLAAEAGARVVAGCLRNATAVGAWAAEFDAPVTVIACGEKWSDGSLRPALEDLLGAGAILTAIPGVASPEARAAMAAFHDAANQLPDALAGCTSGRELARKGWHADVAHAAQLNVSTTVPVLRGKAFAQISGDHSLVERRDSHS